MTNKLLILFLFCCSTIFAQNSKFVNVFIGTDGTGHTFPGPSMPFGMVQPGPDNKDYGWNHTSGYQYKDTLILGFSQTRFSGTGINEMGDVLILPINPKKEKLKNSYYKNTEIGKVGYYALTKKDDVKVELTCSERVAFHQYTFPENQGQVSVDLQHGLRFVFDDSNQKGLVIESDVKIENNTTISGYISTQNWVHRKYFFTLTFDQPFTKSNQLEKKPYDKAPKYLLDFSFIKDRIIKVKIALSSVSIDGAKLNMITEIPHWDFKKAHQNNLKSWDNYLKKISIEAPQKQKEIFYTSLYHLFLQPSNISDVDGKYRGIDDKIAVAAQKEYYSTLSNWDIYRASFPLLQILAPEKIDGIVRTMLIHHKAKGFLPIWTAWGQDNYCMIGNHAIPMILSAFQNGFKGFDPNDALKAIVETSTKSHINSDWELYNQFGYYPFDKLDNEAVSRTLESGYDDWCVAAMAKKLGKEEVFKSFTKRANFYKNLYDKETTFFRGKDSKGNWRTPFNPLIATSPLNNPGDYTEANAWQYFWTPTQHDIDGVTQLLGGKTQFTQKLNEFFTTEAVNPDKFLGQEAMIGQYAHGNEPSHHIIYLYAYSKEPQKGHKYIHQVINDFHNNTPDGMIGNDDCGQMSAWYILSTLGFYPVNPANSEFVLGSPQLKKATIHLAGNKKFIIEAKNFSEKAIYNNIRILNGYKISQPFITYKEIMNGGNLTFNMTYQCGDQTLDALYFPSTDKENVSIEKFKALPFGSVKPTGWLKEQMQKDMDGFVGNLDQIVPELINDPIYSTGRLHKYSKAKDLGNHKEGDAEGDEQYKWWNSETQSNWWDGYLRNVFLLNDKKGIAKVEKYVEAILATQDEDGYIGIYDKELRYQFNSENGELWSKATLYRGMLAYYEFTKDEKVYSAVEKAVENVMTNYPINASSPYSSGTSFNGGVSHGLTFTDVLERLYFHTKNEKYREYASFLYNDFSNTYQSEADVQLKNILNSNYKLKSHGVHTFEHIRALIIAKYAAKNPELENAMTIYLNRIKNATTISGGAIGDEWIAERNADVTHTGYEYCSLQELLDSYCLLLQKTGNANIGDDIENIFYNAAQGSRNPNHSCIAYLKTDNSFEMLGTKNGEIEQGRKQIRYKYSPAHQDVAVCCNPNAGRISPYFIQNSWMKENENILVATLLMPNILETLINDNKIQIENITEYPFKNDFNFKISQARSSKFTLKIRKPDWVKKVKTKEKFKIENDFIVIEREFSSNDNIQISFDTEIQINIDNTGLHYFTYGSLLFALPIKANEITGRTYMGNLIDFTYEPISHERYSFKKRVKKKYEMGKINTKLINQDTGKLENVVLMPIGKTVLRQVTF